jgi:hypothetical protein
MRDLIGRTLGHYRIVEGLRRLPREHNSVTHLGHPPQRPVDHETIAIGYHNAHRRSTDPAFETSLPSCQEICTPPTCARRRGRSIA